MMRFLRLVALGGMLTVGLAGCSGSGETKEPELKGKVESTEIQSAPGDQRPDGGGERDGDK